MDEHQIARNNQGRVLAKLCPGCAQHPPYLRIAAILTRHLLYTTSQAQGAKGEPRAKSREVKVLLVTTSFPFLSLLPRCSLPSTWPVQHTWQQVFDSGPPIATCVLCMYGMLGICPLPVLFVCTHAPICLEIPEPANPKIENGGGWRQKP